ncbi:DUF1868 domain-containing protein [Inquilinus sp. NPDC058860]|uniref:DUF1868 domain-containing protein n=1 Tax=Inquilinus sp. NPDC058860 TaxID=3346652 RepID=UPI003695EE36
MDHIDFASRLTAPAEGAPNPTLGYKFARDGSPLPFRGNTIICHILETAPELPALAELANRLRDLPWGGRFAFLPASSYHMTVFEGVTYAERSPERWPEGVAPDAPLEDITRRFIDRLHGLSVPQRFAMRPVGLVPMGTGGTVVGLEPADEDTTRQIRGLREAFALILGLRKPNHESYRFHITLSYLLEWLSPAEAERHLAAHQRLGEAFIEAHPVLQLGPPEFCVFETLHRFLPVLRFQG